MRPSLAAITFSVAAILVGCGEPKRDLLVPSLEVTPEGKSFTVAPIGRAQKIEVRGSVLGSPASVYIFLEKNRDAAMTQIVNNKLAEIVNNKLTSVILAQREVVEPDGIFLTAMIPANETAVVHVRRFIRERGSRVEYFSIRGIEDK
jgi:hypothetical protein